MEPELRKALFNLSLGLLVAATAALGYGLWIAKLDAAGPNRLVVPLRLMQDGEAQLFYDRGRGLIEEDSARVQVLASDTIDDVAFPVPREPLRQIRFDPFIGAGKFAIGRPRLETATGRVIAKFPVEAVVPAFQIKEFKREATWWLGETVANAVDPQLAFGLGKPLRVGAPRLPWPEALAVLALAIAAWRLRPKQTAAAPAAN